MEIRTVNHRYFNLSLKVPNDLAHIEADLREALRREFDRGHISLSIRWVEVPERRATLTVDVERARQVAVMLRELKEALELSGEVDLQLVVRQPDVFTADSSGQTPVEWAEFEPVVREAVVACKEMRRREGAVLVGELNHRLDLLEEGRRAVGQRAPERLMRERDRLRTAVAALLDGRPADENRLAQEIAFLADKLDVTEELVRFASHLAACRATLAADIPAGKQLGFLAQELGREVNTIGSKANDPAITQDVIRMKGELEKFREQVENLE